MKIKVTPAQYDYYVNHPKTSSLLTRLVREFLLPFPQARHLLDLLIQGKYEEVFEVFGEGTQIPLPAYDGDSRRIFYLPSDQYDWLQDRLEGALGGPLYENFDSLTPELRDSIMEDLQDKFYPSRMDILDRQRLEQMGRQGFLGVRSLDISSVSNMDEIVEWLNFQIEGGSTVSTAVSDYFKCMSMVTDPLQLATSYGAVAEFLYDEAEKIINERKDS